MAGKGSSERVHEAAWRGNVTPDGNDEGPFREEVRNILDMSHMSRNDQIFDELRRLKDVERCAQIDDEEARAGASLSAAKFRATEESKCK